MSKINPTARDRADEEFHKKHPELKNRSLSPNGSDDAALRAEWWSLYKNHLRKLQNSRIPQTHKDTIDADKTSDNKKFTVPTPKFKEGFWLTIKQIKKTTKARLGQTVSIHIKTENIPIDTSAEIQVMEYDPSILLLDDKIGPIQETTINGEINFEFELKDEWCDNDEWYDSTKNHKSELYFKVSADVNNKTIEAEFPQKTDDYLIVSPRPTIEFIELKTENDNNSFTTMAGENSIGVKAEVNEDDLNENIEWEIVDNPDNAGNSPVPDISELRGENVEIVIDIPRVAAGRNWEYLSYKIRAKLEYEEEHFVYSEWKVVTQDEIDMLRQQYFDMSKTTVPERDEFINSGSTEHFDLAEGACQCGRHNYHLWSIMNNLENIRTTLNHAMPVNSGYRCPIRNLGEGGVSNSLHIYGLAADIAFLDYNGNGRPDNSDRDHLEELARNEGANEVLLYPSFVHIGWE